MSKINIFLLVAAISASFGCGASGTSKNNASTNINGPVEIKLDPNNMPPGLSATPIAMPANGKLPEGISVNGAAPVQGRTPIPGIPSAEQLKKGFKIGSTPIPGIDPEAARKQLGYPATNVEAPPKGDLMMMKKRRPGVKQQ
jgi:hypothetical protein